MLAIYLMAIDTPADKSKFETLYIKYEKLLFYVAFDILKDHHLAEDAVNNAFIRIIDNLDKIDKIDCPQTKRFVVIITKNICLDMLRKKNRHNETIIDISESQAFLDSVDSAQSAQDEFFMQFDMNSIKQAFHKLQPDYQMALYYHAILGESINKVAELMGVKPEAAKKRIYRARKALRTMLAEDKNER